MIDYEKFKGHTPGPWCVSGLKITAEDPEMPSFPWEVAKVYGDAFYEGDDPTECNASLIAAAPELLEENKRLREAIRQILHLIEFDDERSDKRRLIDAAICAHNALLNP